jgi:hypothetical protein
MMPTMLKVTPTAALFAKKPLEIAPAVGEAETVDVEPVEVIRKPVTAFETPWSKVVVGKTAN